MCGITGFWCNSFFGKSQAECMASRIATRGPDSAGVWIDEGSGIALAHRRLSVLDLSPAGHQPMHSPCKRYTIVYNGEIYNHLEIRTELNKVGGSFDWRGHSDTETLLAALCYWGLKGTLGRLIGMFAFVLWDAQDRVLYLARDRMGEKPLYFGRVGGTFLFGSELKALAAHPDWRGEVNRDALALYTRLSYVPAPLCVYKGIYKLRPAHFVVVRECGQEVSEQQCYWDLGKVAECAVTSLEASEEMLIDELDTLLRDVVRQKMLSDVPIGAFLSGGYDSSLVAAIMQSISYHPVKTFTVGFYEKGYNEATHAKAVAAHLKTDHTELYVSSKDAMDVIPKLPSIYDEPFSDSSQIPTFLICELARRHVTVSLTGDGGDELFCGYNRYVHGLWAWQKLRVFPKGIRKTITWLLNHASGQKLDKLQWKLPRRLQVSNLADRLPKLSSSILHYDEGAFYRELISRWNDPEKLIISGREPEETLACFENLPELPGLRERMMYLDQLNYLPDDILTKLDRASMAVSLESRVPLLDHRVVEFAWSVPTEYKYRESHGKWILRKVLYRHIPRELMERPKMGFGVPIGQWLAGELREWAEELLRESRLRAEGFFDPVQIRELWNEHIEGRQGRQDVLWNVLMFQAWLEEQNQHAPLTHSQ